MMTPAVKKALELLAKEFKKPPVIFSSKRDKVEAIDSRSLILNQLFGCGGWPRGRIIELFGAESSGKTTLCYHAMAEAQQLGVVAFIDTEHRAELSYAAALGVDCDNLIFDQPSGGEDAFEKIEAMLDSKLYSLIVLDSIAHAKPKVVASSDIDSSNIGIHAKMMTKVMDRIGKKLGKTCLLMTNQIRKDPSGYGSGETTPGGMAVKFDASLRVRIQKQSAERDKEENPILNKVKAKVVKSSVGIPYKEAEFVIRFGEGVAICDDTLDAGILAGIITKAGGNHSIIIHGKKETIGRSRDQALVWLSQKGRAEKIRQAIIKSKWYAGDQESKPEASGEVEEVSRDGGDEAGEEPVSEVRTMREYILRPQAGAAPPIREAEEADDSGDSAGSDEEADDSDGELTL